MIDIAQWLLLNSRLSIRLSHSKITVKILGHVQRPAGLCVAGGPDGGGGGGGGGDGDGDDGSRGRLPVLRLPGDVRRRHRPRAPPARAARHLRVPVRVLRARLLEHERAARPPRHAPHRQQGVRVRRVRRRVQLRQPAEAAPRKAAPGGGGGGGRGPAPQPRRVGGAGRQRPRSPVV